MCEGIRSISYQVYFDMKSFYIKSHERIKIHTCLFTRNVWFPQHFLSTVRLERLKINSALSLLEKTEGITSECLYDQNISKNRYSTEE